MKNRRQILQSAACAPLFLRTAALAGLGSCSSIMGPDPKRILILGGTGFLGPALIDALLERGHRVTLFNSGSTEQRREANGRPSVVPPGVETLVGNRDPLLTADDRRYARDPDGESKKDPDSPRGLTQLQGRRWDAVIDTSGYFPRMVRASAELLAASVEQYVFISSISVYAHNDVPDQDESAELVTLADPGVEEFGEGFVNYGGGKALCEAAAEGALPGRTTNIRPGYIVGRGDTSGRWSYWPWRTTLGGSMLVPGTPSDPLQVIDVRDLAEWIVHCVERRIVGVFNATGPAKELTMKAMLAGCETAADLSGSAPATPVWAAPEFLTENELSFPIWAPPTGETAGFHRTNIQRALENGLRFRPIENTAADTLAWLRSLPEELRSRVLPPIDLALEQEVLQRWLVRRG